MFNWWALCLITKYILGHYNVLYYNPWDARALLLDVIVLCQPGLGYRSPRETSLGLTCQKLDLSIYSSVYLSVYLASYLSIV